MSEGLRAFDVSEAQLENSMAERHPGAVRSATSPRARDILDGAQGFAERPGQKTGRFR